MNTLCFFCKDSSREIGEEEDDKSRRELRVDPMHGCCQELRSKV